MHDLLQKLFKKKGIKDLMDRDLGDLDKVDFDKWEKILSAEREVSIPQLVKFLKMQIALVEKKWRDPTQNPDLSKLTMLHTCYSMMLEAINAPQAEREALEKYLQGLIDS